MFSDLPAWKQLIDSNLAAHERMPLVTAVFSNRGGVKVAGGLCGDDAQTFVDMTDEVSLNPFTSKTGPSSPHV